MFGADLDPALGAMVYTTVRRRAAADRWSASSSSPRCSSRSATRSWSSRSAWSRAGSRWRPPVSTSRPARRRGRDWDAFDEGQALRGDMLRSFVGPAASAALFGGQVLIGLAVSGPQHHADRAAVHQPRDRDRDQRAGRSAGRAAGPAGVLPLAGSAGRPRRAAPHRGGAAAAVGQPARRHGRRHLRAAHPPRARPLRRPVQAGRQPADRPADHRRAAGAPRRARSTAGARQRAAGRCSPSGSPGSSPATAASSAPPNSGATTTRCISPTSSACAPTRRTPPPPDWIRWPRQAWQWFVTEVPQRSLHNWQNAAARVIATDLRGNLVTRALTGAGALTCGWQELAASGVDLAAAAAHPR